MNQNCKQRQAAQRCTKTAQWIWNEISLNSTQSHFKWLEWCSERSFLVAGHTQVFTRPAVLEDRPRLHVYATTVTYATITKELWEIHFHLGYCWTNEATTNCLTIPLIHSKLPGIRCMHNLIFTMRENCNSFQILNLKHLKQAFHDFVPIVGHLSFKGHRCRSQPLYHIGQESLFGNCLID